MDWPLYWKENLIIGNVKSNLGVATLWTPKEKFLEFFDKKDFAVIGQLYSKDEGINSLLRNCLANPLIRYIFLLGVDLSGSGQTLINLVERGVDENHNIFGAENAVIDKEISRDAIELFRKNVAVIDLRRNFDKELVRKKLFKLKKLKSYSKSLKFPEKKLEPEIIFPSEKTAFRVEEETVAKAWLRILQLALKFGFVKKSQHGEQQREIMNLIAVITGDDPDSVAWKDYFPFSKDELLQYYPQLVTGMSVSEVTYTYGQRLRSYGKIDQLKSLIELLKKHPHSRRGINVLYDVEQDISSDNAPCLILVQCLVQDEKLFLTCYFRSHDLFDGWPKNVFGLLKLQKYISEESGLKIGSLTVISNSAHVYERNWKKTQNILSMNPLRYRIRLDPRGNLSIRVKDDFIEVLHVDNNGKRLDEFRVKSAQEALKKLYVEERISDISHAMDIGMELMKAELALKHKLNYEQDKNLEKI
jgi:thymidylate synthase